jgi:hypothetical protein
MLSGVLLLRDQPSKWCGRPCWAEQVGISIVCTVRRRRVPISSPKLPSRCTDNANACLTIYSAWRPLIANKPKRSFKKLYSLQF